DVQANQIKGAKGCALRAAGGGPGDLVYFFDGVAVVEHRLDRVERAESADPVGDKVWPIFRGHDAFAEALVEKAVKETGDFGLGPLGANYLDQVKVTRWIEEVDAEKVLFEIVGAAFGE